MSVLTFDTLTGILSIRSARANCAASPRSHPPPDEGKFTRRYSVPLCGLGGLCARKFLLLAPGFPRAIPGLELWDAGFFRRQGFRRRSSAELCRTRWRTRRAPGLQEILVQALPAPRLGGSLALPARRRARIRRRQDYAGQGGAPCLSCIADRRRAPYCLATSSKSGRSLARLFNPASRFLPFLIASSAAAR